MDSISYRHQNRLLRRARHELAQVQAQQLAATTQATTITRLLDVLPHFVFIFDLPTNSLQYCNEFVQTMLGYSASELREMDGHLIDTLMPPEEAARLRQHYVQIARQPDGVLLYFEYVLQHRNGGVRWLRVGCAPFSRDAQGHVLQVLGSAEDITRWKVTDEQRRSANRRLAEQNRLFRQVIDTVPNLIYLKDPSGNYVLANQATASFYNLTTEELIQTPFSELESRLPDLGRYQQQDQRVLRSGQEVDEESSGTDGQGRRRWFRTIKRPFELGNGTVQVLGIDNDITELKQTQQALETAKETAEHNAQTRQQFLTNMSHEIRTPMNGIVGLTGLLAKTPLNPEQQQLLGHVQHSADNLLVIINDILDMAQLGAGRMKVEQVPFELAEVLRASCQALLPMASQKGITLRLHLPPPEKAGPPLVLGDPFRLRQVLLNLLGNAVKFTQKGQVLLTYQCPNPTAALPRYQFSVFDTGIGIAPQQLRELFEPFTQASASTAREYGGSGLGLSISHGLVALLGGELTADSELGRGSTFRFTLALAPAPETAPVPLVPLPDFGQLRGRRVLLTEDNAVNQLLIQAMMRNWGGIILDTASSGAKALALFRQHHYALVLMDIQMPGMDGVATTQLLRQHPDPIRAATPVVALTAHAMPGDAERYRAAGLDAYLAKPFQECALFEVMANLLMPALPPTTTLLPTQEVPTTAASAPPAPAGPAPAQLAISARVPPPPLYDLSGLYRLSGNDEAFVQRLVQMFIDTTPPAIAQLEHHCRRRELPKLAAQAHFLKSSTDGLRLLSLQPLLRELAEPPPPTPPNWPHLERLVAQVSATVAEVVRQLRHELPT